MDLFTQQGMYAVSDSATSSPRGTAIYAFSLRSATEEILFEMLQDEHPLGPLHPLSRKLPIRLRTKSVGTHMKTASIATSISALSNRPARSHRSQASSNPGSHGVPRPPPQRAQGTTKQLVGAGTQFPASPPDPKPSDLRSSKASSDEGGFSDIKDREEKIKSVFGKVEAANLATQHTIDVPQAQSFGDVVPSTHGH